MGANNSVPADYTAAAYAILILDVVMTTAAVLGRTVSRKLQKGPLSIDDVLAYCAYTANLALLITGLTLTASGGLDLQKLHSQEEHRRHFQRAGWVSLAILYIITITFIKLSMLLLYRRTFTMFETWFRVAWWTLLHITILWTVACTILLTIRYTTKTPTAAFSRLSISVTGLVNAVSDIFLVLMPALLVLRMKLHTRQKIALISIFAIGIIASTVSLVRSTIFFQNRTLALNEAYSNYLDITLTATEASAGLMCACLPLTKPLVVRFTRWTQHLLGHDTEHQGWTTVDTGKPVGKGSRGSSGEGNSSDIERGAIVMVHDYRIEMESVETYTAGSNPYLKPGCGGRGRAVEDQEPWRSAGNANGVYGTQTRVTSRPASPGPERGGLWEWQSPRGAQVAMMREARRENGK